MRNQPGMMMSSVHQAPPTHPQYGSSAGLPYRGGGAGSMGHMAYQHGPPPQYGSRGAMGGPQYGSNSGLGGQHRGAAGSVSSMQHRGGPAGSVSSMQHRGGPAGSVSSMQHRGATTGSVSSAHYRGQPAQAEKAPSESGSQSTRVGESFV